MALFSPFGFQSIALGGLIFEIAREDIAGDPSYFGYLNNSGAWAIQRRTASTGVYDYCQGKNSFSTAWTNRAGLAYVEYNALINPLPSGL